jgi:hypothetical protein
MDNFISNDELLYKQKYLKYKTKYLDLKEQEGGFFTKDTSLLFYNKESYPDLVSGIEKYKGHLQAQAELKNDAPAASPTSSPTQSGGKEKAKKAKAFDLVELPHLNINGIPCMWKYSLGRNVIEPVFTIFMEFQGADIKDKDSIAARKKNIADLEKYKKEYIKMHTIDIKKETIAGLNNMPYQQFLNTINCDSFQTKGYLLATRLNELLVSKKVEREALYNKIIELSEKTATVQDEQKNKQYKPIAITKSLGLKLKAGAPIKDAAGNEKPGVSTVEQIKPVNDFILINNFKMSSLGSAFLSKMGIGTDKTKLVTTFTINTIKDVVPASDAIMGKFNELTKE